MISIAIIGTGKIVKEILPVLSDMNEIQIKILCSTERSRQTLLELQETYKIPNVYTDYSDFLTEVRENTALSVDVIYLAVPNHLHFEMAKQALQAGLNVFLEKPFTPSLPEAEELIELSRQKPAMLIEAISTQYLPQLQTIKQLLPALGQLRYAEVNFSQYSSRYDAFCAGQVSSTFDSACYGGALMDLQVYNLHLLSALFGEPESITYHANMEKGIDTSGVIHLEYPSFQAISIAAKDSDAPCRLMIQGTGGYLLVEAKPNILDAPILLYLHGQGSQEIPVMPQGHRMEAEFRALDRMLIEKDWYRCISQQQQTLNVCRILDAALKQIPYGEANKQLNDLRKAFWA